MPTQRVQSPFTPPTPLLRQEVPVAFAHSIVAAYARRRLAPTDALKLAQITPQQLNNPLGSLDANQFEVLTGVAMQALDDEGLGAFSRALPWGSYGMLARASVTSPTLGIALSRWCRHHGLLTQDITLHLSTGESHATIGITEQANLGTMRELCLVQTLRNIHGLACWYIDSRIGLRDVAMPFAKPAHSALYSGLFAGSVKFDRAQAALTFDARYLHLPLRRDERALQLMLQRALPLTVQQYRRDRLLVQQVRQALAAHPAQTHNAQGLADLLHISSRTLHRQLRDEGASLQQLKDDVRSEQAKALLLRTDYPVKQVAAAVGFHNEKSFIRRFRQWTGLPPAAYRQAARTAMTPMWHRSGPP